jgi:hypothetical protein
MVAEQTLIRYDTRLKLPQQMQDLSDEIIIH